MVPIRCASAVCSCDSEVQFHAGTSSYCSEYCAFTEEDAAAPCECTHPGCEAEGHEIQARYPPAASESAGTRSGDGRSAS
jgi:hypothetical protein